jgi:serine/threonine-protein kinase
MDHRLGSRYLLKERLGRGAMGTVWRAVNTDTNTDVAVKVLSEELSDEPEMVARFIQERNALVAVRHPNLVRIHDLVVEDGRLAIIMDLIPGPDLHRHLMERGVLGLTDAAVIGRGVAGALEAIHSAGIIHRDLKPANILLDLSGPRPEPKLVDFGIARMLSGSRLTARSSVVGTPQYLSPEAISGAEPGPSVDIYAFGIALYELFNGTPPFHGEQLLQVLNQHMYQEPPWPPSIPPQILPLLQAMLAKNPQVRPAAADVARQMDAIIAAGPYPTPVPLPSPQQPQPTQLPPPPASPLAAPLIAQAGPYSQPPQPSPYAGASPPTPYPAAPLPAPYGRPQPTPLPGPPGTPQPGGTPIPAPSPSGFFYPNAGMLDPTYSTPNPAGGAVFAPGPPPFSDEMFAPKKQRSRKKLLVGGGIVLALAAVGGLVFALTGGTSNNNQPIAAGTTKSAATAASKASASPSPTVAPSCPAQAVSPAAVWPLNGTAVGCASSGDLHLFGDAHFENSARGEVLKLNGQSARATMPIGSLVDTAHSFTVSAWVDMDTLPKTTKTLVAFQGKTLDAFEVQYNPAGTSWAFGRSSVDAANAQWVVAEDPKAAHSHAWTHVVGVYDSAGHSITLYVNGVKAATRAGVSGWTATGKITLGASLDAGGKPYQDFAGELSEVEVFTSALTQAQVDGLK